VSNEEASSSAAAAAAPDAERRARFEARKAESKRRLAAADEDPRISLLTLQIACAADPHG
jgi:hypothetical protein